MSSNLVSNFNKRFVELADTLPYNDSELAQKLGVSRQTISAWRTGARSPHTPAIQFVAQTLAVNVAWLSGWDVPMYDNHKPNKQEEYTEREKNLITKYRYIDDNGRAVVDTTLETLYNQAREREMKH